MITFKQAQDDVLLQLKEVSGDTGFWILQEIKNAINDAYVRIADEAHCFRLKAVIEIKAGIRIYKLPSNYIIGTLNRVEFDKKKIYPITSDELDASNRSWRNVSGSDITHFIPPGDICASDEIAFYPKPDTDGEVYNLAADSDSGDNGVITTIGDDSYEEFESDEGVIVAADGDEVEFDGENGAVQDIQNPVNNAVIYASKYPKRLFRDNEVFLHPVTYNPRKVVTLGAMSILLAKEGDGKDIAKASFYNKRFTETIEQVFQVPNVRKTHRMKSISDGSISGRLNLGEHYPKYVR